MFVIATILAAVVTAAATLKYSLRIVPAQSAAVMQRWGAFSRVVGPGAYLMVPMRDSFRTVTWSYPEETAGDGRAPRDSTVRPIVRRVVRTDVLSMGDQRMDVVPCEGVTSDSVTVSINGTLNYRITDAQRAAYNVSDPLAFMVDSVFAAVRKIVAERSHLDMIGADAVIADAIMAHVNERIEDYGVTCTQFLVQGIDMDDEIKRSYERAIVAERSRETELARHQAEVDFKRQQEKADFERQKQHADIEAQKQVDQLTRKRQLAEAKAEHDAALLTAETRKRLAIMEAEGQETAKRQRLVRDKAEAELRDEAEIHKVEAQYKLAAIQAEHERVAAEQAAKRKREEDAERARLEFLQLRAECERKDLEILEQRGAIENKLAVDRARAEYEHASAQSRAQMAGHCALVEQLADKDSEHISSALAHIMTAKDMGAALGSTSKMILPTETFRNSPFASIFMGGLRRLEHALCEDDVIPSDD